jgi:uncharacterized membrane protein
VAKNDDDDFEEKLRKILKREAEEKERQRQKELDEELRRMADGEDN